MPDSEQSEDQWSDEELLAWCKESDDLKNAIEKARAWNTHGQWDDEIRNWEAEREELAKQYWARTPSEAPPVRRFKKN